MLNWLINALDLMSNGSDTMAKKINAVTEEQWLKINPENRKITDRFLNQLQLSPQTLKQYKSAARIFFRWIYEFEDDLPLHKLKPRHALNYQNYLISLQLSPNAIKFKRNVVSSLCGYYEVFYGEDYPLFRNIFNKKIPNVSKQNVREKVPLSKEEYDLLCSELEEREEWQMAAFLKFTYSSGCRKSEVHQLLKEVTTYEKVKDKEGNYKNFYRTHNIRTKGKGIEGNVRKLFFDENAMLAIKKWLVIRGDDDCPYVFVNKTKNGNVNQLSSNTFNYWASTVFSEIIGRHMFVHLIRSTRATHLVVDDNKDIKTAQQVLGHADSSTTELYVVRDESDMADDAFE